MFRVFLCLLICCHFTFSEFENVHKKHEYNLTFKSPLIILPSSNEIPFFDMGGHIIPGRERVRLTTSLPNQQGWIWSKNTSSLEGFQLDLVFKITGSGRIGADGLAVWIVKNKSSGGPALGSSNMWNGLGIFFDTYDNDGHADNPIVFAIINDGTKIYDSSTDGRDISVGHCVREYRNRPHPIHARIMYYNETLEVSISSGIESSTADLEKCFQAHAILPRADYYFGVSASTGMIADDHDIEKFEVHSLSDISNMEKSSKEKLLEKQREYEEEFQKKLDNITKNETETKSRQNDEADYVDINRNLIVIWQEISRQNKELKLILNIIESIHKFSLSKSEKSVGNEFSSHLEATRKEFLGVKSSVDYLSRKMESGGDGFQQHQTLNQIQNSINNIKTEMTKEFEKIITLQHNLYQTQDKIQNSITNRSKDDQCGSCLSPILLVSISTIQVACIIGYLIYQRNKDNSAKKFY